MPSAASARRWTALGVAGAAVVLSCLGLLVALATPPFAGADEAQHVAYALEVSDGRLPDLYTPVRSAVPGMLGLPAGCQVPAALARSAIESGTTAGLPACAVRDGAGPSVFDLIYTANHPPLFYLLQALPLGWGTGRRPPLAGFDPARGLR